MFLISSLKLFPFPVKLSTIHFLCPVSAEADRQFLDISLYRVYTFLMDLDEILSKKLSALFTNPLERKKVEDILSTYGIESYEREITRVQFAVLKLSGSEFSEVKKYVGYAKQDYRDILLWAEYPRQAKCWNIKDLEEKQRIIDADQKEYESWLKD